MKVVKNKNYVLGLDGVRALAIIGVTLFHIYPSVVKGGYLGVSLFLVLTGFLLAMTSQHEFHVLKYYWKRIKRIYPSLCIVVLCTCAFLFLFSRSSLSGMKPEVLSIFAGYNNWWQIAQNSDYFTRISNASPFTHLWYMGIELQFYLVWPLIYLFYKYAKNKRIPLIGLGVLSILSALIMLILYSPSSDVTRIYYGTDTRVHALLIGCILGFLYRDKKYKFHPSINIMVTILSALILVLTGILWFSLDGQSAILYRGGMFGITLLFGLLIFMIANPNFIVGRLFENPVFKWIGRHSFAIYLWQYPVMYCFATFKLTKIPFYSILEIALILLLSMGLDRFLGRMKTIKDNPTVIIPFLCIVLCMGLGTYGLVTSTNEKKEAVEEVQKQLEENAEKLKEQPKQEFVGTDHVVLIGDSVLLGASEAVSQVLPDCTIDAAVSRYVGEEFPILQSFDQQGILKDTVVISMGTNGILYDYVVYQTLDYLGTDRNIFWINNYCPYSTWETSNNEFLNSLPAKYPNVHIIDWYTEAVNHPEYLSGDGVHPDTVGCEAYANLIKTSIESTEKVQKSAE